MEALFTLRDGTLLVRRHGRPGTVLDVFDSLGVRQGTIDREGLDRLEIQEATSDALYRVMRGEMDVPHVVRPRIERGRG